MSLVTDPKSARYATESHDSVDSNDSYLGLLEWLGIGSVAILAFGVIASAIRSEELNKSILTESPAISRSYPNPSTINSTSKPTHIDNQKQAKQIRYDSKKNVRITHLHESMGSTFHRVRTRGSDTSGIRTVITTPQSGILISEKSREYHFNGYVGFRDRQTGVNVEAGVSLSRDGESYVPFMRVNSLQEQRPQYLTNGSLRHSKRRVRDNRIDCWTNMDVSSNSEIYTIRGQHKLSLELKRTGEQSLTFIVRPASGQVSRKDEGRITLHFPQGTLGDNVQFRRVVSFDGKSIHSKSELSQNNEANFSVIRLGTTQIQKSSDSFRNIEEPDVIQDINHEGTQKTVFATPIEVTGSQLILFE